MRSSEDGTVHIIGAGLAGLSAAVRLCGLGRGVVVHEATAHAGGRCRSYFDQATDMMIDNGAHLLLSGNHAALSFVETIGSSAGLHGPSEAEFDFIDLPSGEKWTLRFGDGRFPWWVFDKDRRVPQTDVVDYLPLARLLWTSADKPIAEVISCSGRFTSVCSSLCSLPRSISNPARDQRNWPAYLSVKRSVSPGRRAGHYSHARGWQTYLLNLRFAI